MVALNTSLFAGVAAADNLNGLTTINTEDSSNQRSTSHNQDNLIKSQISAQKFKNINTLVYVPPRRGSPKRRVGAATRGAEKSLNIVSLSPNHTGLTTKSQPVLFYYLSDTTDKAIEFTLIQEGMDDPLIETILEASSKGIHSIDLSRFEKKLSLDVEYRWFVSLIVNENHRSNDIVSGGYIRYLPASAKLNREITKSSPSKTPSLYAQAGIWYDTLQLVDQQIKIGNHKNNAEQQFLTLLKQINIDYIQID